MGSSEDSTLFDTFPSKSRIVMRPGYGYDDSLKPHSLTSPIYLGRAGSGLTGSPEYSSAYSHQRSTIRVSTLYTGNKPKDSEDKARLLPSELQVSTDHIEDKDMGEYAAEYFAHKRLYGLFKTAEMMYGEKALTGPLHHGLGAKLSYLATSVFKSLLCYTGVKPTKKELNYHARYILRHGIKHKKLRDEIYCQIVKQATHNPNAGSSSKCWAMLALCTGTFRPSEEFEPYLQSFFKENILNQSQSYLIQKYSKYALLRLSKTHGITRKFAPSNEEIDSILVREPVQINVCLINETNLVGEVESWTTAKALTKQVCRQLHIKNTGAFALYEVNDLEGGERLVGMEESPLDLLSFWESQQDPNVRGEFRLVFKILRVPDKLLRSVPDTQLEYYQAVNDVLNNRYPMTTLDHINLAGLILHELNGDATQEDVIGDRLADYLPTESFDVGNHGTLKEQVRRAHAICKGLTQHTARVKYIEYVRDKVKLYGSSYFAVHLKVGKKSEPMFVAINRRGFHMIDWKMVGIQDTISMELVQKCSFTDKRFFMFVYQKMREFVTQQGKEMFAVYEAYCQEIDV